MTNKKDLSERDICTKYIQPALEAAGWDNQTQIREEVFFTDGRIYVRGNLTRRGEAKRADYILYYKPNIPLALIEVKNNRLAVGAGMQQALGYAEILDIPFVFSTNGDGFLAHDRTQSEGLSEGLLERELPLDRFPSPADLWAGYKRYRGLETPEQERISVQPYFFDGSGRAPRYYQQIAVNRTVEAIAKGQNRILLTMATGTGKTYTAFQIIYRLRKSGAKSRILFLADRNALIDQTRRGDFRFFTDKMTVIRHKHIDKAYEVYLALYQGLTDYNPDKDAYRQFRPGFFDLVVIDECHRGSAADDNAWREILTYFSEATHIGLTATPKETTTISNTDYFGDPIYTYSLKQGIEDGFLAPYKVLRVGLNVDLEGWRPEAGKTDKTGSPLDDRLYNRWDFDKNIVIDERTKAVADRVTEYLHKNGRFNKTIIFCVDIEHAQRMRHAIANANSDLMSLNWKYVVQITGDNHIGKRELDNFINPEEDYPVVVTTSKLMTTGVDTQTCQLIVLDSNINSMTEFKQIIGRGTRINEAYGKMYFTIMDFRNVTNLFADPAFDGDPVRLKEVSPMDEFESPADELRNDYGLDDDKAEEYAYPAVDYPAPAPGPLLTGGEVRIIETKGKYYVDGVDVAILNERVQYLDHNGKLITSSLKAFTRQKVRARYKTLDHFLIRWCEADKTAAILDELLAKGLILDHLRGAIDAKMDLFDLICHVAFDRPPLTRAQRANKVKDLDIFDLYAPQAQRVLEALLDKYASDGIETIENNHVLQLPPLTEFGSPAEIINNTFGGSQHYKMALATLKREIYSVAA